MITEFLQTAENRALSGRLGKFSAKPHKKLRYNRNSLGRYRNFLYALRAAAQVCHIACAAPAFVRGTTCACLGYGIVF